MPISSFLSRFNNPHVRKAAMEAFTSRAAEHQHLSRVPLAVAQEKAIAELNEVATRSFSPLPGKTDAVFNSGYNSAGQHNFFPREKFIKENSNSFGDWHLKGGSTQWISDNIDGKSRLPFFAFNSALLAHYVARDPNVKVIVPFTDGITQAKSPDSIWVKHEFPTMLHEASQGANPNFMGVSGKHIVDKIGVSNIDKPEVVFPLSRALGSLVKDGVGLNTSVPVGSRIVDGDPVRPGEFTVKPAPLLQEPGSPLKQETPTDAHKPEAHVQSAHDETGALTLGSALALPTNAGHKETTDHMLAALLANDSAVMYAGISAGLDTGVSQRALQEASHIDAHHESTTQTQSQPAPQITQVPVKKH